MTIDKLIRVALSLAVIVFTSPVVPASAGGPALELYPTYCADNTGAAPCATGIASWVAAGIAQHRALHAAAGSYRCEAPVNIDLHGVSGFKMAGDGRNITNFVCDPGVAQSFYVHGDPGDNLTFADIEGFTVAGNSPGISCQFGRADFGDALNIFHVKIYCLNGSTAGTAEAAQVNYCMTCTFDMVANGGGFNSVTNTGVGFAALDIRQAEDTTFKGSYGISGVGILLRDGNIWGLHFDDVDVEANTYDVDFFGPSIQKIMFTQGQISLASYGLICTSGSQIIFDTTNFAGLTNQQFDNIGCVLR